jgi:ribonuclease HI
LPQAKSRGGKSALELPFLAVYADESCLGNGREGSNPGGAGGVIEYVSQRTARLTRWDYWVSEPATTNNRMALRSVIEAFRLISRKGTRFRVRFTSDSQYLVKGMTEWVHKWIVQGWRRKEGVLENVELWKQAVEAARPHQVEWRWVRGHHGQPQNEYANHLATRAARELSASDGLVASVFDQWLLAEVSKGKIRKEPDGFPDASSFKPGRSFPVSGPILA